MQNWMGVEKKMDVSTISGDQGSPENGYSTSMQKMDLDVH